MDPGGPIAIVGPGAVGCTCAAALLSKHRERLLHCARRPIPQPVVIQQPERPLIALDLPLLTDPASAPRRAAIVFLAVKAHQTASAAAWLAALAGPDTVVAILQNGIEHLESVTPQIGPATPVPIVVHCSSTVLPSGVVSLLSPLLLRAPETPASHHLSQLFGGSAARFEIAPDFTTALWHKLILNAVCGLMAAHQRPAVIYRSGPIRELALKLAEECARVGTLAGARLETDVPRRIVDELGSLPPDRGTSILTDRLAGRRLEWDARNGVVSRLGRLFGVATPISDDLARVLRAASPETEPPLRLIRRSEKALLIKHVASGTPKGRALAAAPFATLTDLAQTTDLPGSSLAPTPCARPRSAPPTTRRAAR